MDVLLMQQDQAVTPCTTPALVRTQVCGRVIGYQVGSTDAFNMQLNYTIDDAYLDGVSITYGEPRMHIWTYAAGLSNVVVFDKINSLCPCAIPFLAEAPPSFVGNNYSCESGNPDSSVESNNTLTYTDDPLWDGQNCEGQCCTAPLWFSVQLTNATAIK